MNKNLLMGIIFIIGIFLLAGSVSATATVGNATKTKTTLDKSLLSNVQNKAATATINKYVNSNTGDDLWDGSSPTHISGTIGPFKTVNAGINSLNANNGGNLHIANGIYLISGQLNVAHNSNIYGENRDNTIIDGNYANRVFLINENVYVTIEKITIRNGGFPKSDHGDAGKDGAGIYNKGNLILDNCNINNNIAGHGGSAHLLTDAGRGGYGGGIFNYKTGNLTIGNSIIHDNSAGKGGSANESNNGAHGGHGGAIFNQGILNILSCEIYNNQGGIGGNPKEGFKVQGSGGYGGALYNDDGVNAQINSSNIHDNAAGTGLYGGHGGAIFNNGTLTLTGCAITNNQAIFLTTGMAQNKAGGNGGGIYNQKTLNITNCQIKNNNAGDGPKGDNATWKKNVYYYAGGNGENGGSGGGIYNTGTLTITGSTISNNRAGNGGNGGNGCPCFETTSDNGVTIDIYSTLDPGNGGNGGNGGGIYNNGNIISITNSTINNNNAGKGGDGGSYADDYNISLGLKVNPGKSGIGGSGGGIYSPGTLNKIENSTIDYNQAGNGGNGKSVSRYSAENGNTGGNGGGLVLYNSITITNCQISENKAGDGGNGGKTSIPENNPGTKPGIGGNAGHGGGIYINITSINLVLNITKTTMNNNLAGNGGNIGIDDANTYNSQINGISGGNGGAIVLISNNVSYLKSYIYESTFTNNQAGQGSNGQNNGQNGVSGSGGAIYSHNNNYLTMKFCRVVDNAPQAVYMDINTAYPLSLPLINNWWGSNAGPVNQITGNNSAYIVSNPFIKLNTNANPSSILNSKNSTITGNLLMNSNGEDTSTYGMYVPDGTPVTFKTEAGTVNPTNSVTTNGVSSTIFTANTAGSDTVNVTVDHQTVPTTIQVTPWADVVLTKIVNGEIIEGQDFTATITAENKGPDLSTNLEYRNSIPTQFKFITASTDKGTWIYDNTTKILTWTIGNLQVGESAHLYLTLKALQTGTHSLTSTLISTTYDPYLENHNTPLIVQVNAPEAINNKKERNESQIKAANNTIIMQQTGVPTAGLILAILMLIGGLISSKRK